MLYWIYTVDFLIMTAWQQYLAQELFRSKSEGKLHGVATLLGLQQFENCYY